MQSNLTLQQLRYITEVVECGSINAASQNLYVSQPALSTAIKDAEQELGIEIFNRSNRGITLTQEGVEFVGYARQVLEQVDLLEARYSGTGNKAVQKLSISSQHYAFCVKAFVDLVEEYDQDEYEFTLRETRTAEIIEDVKSYRSELGVLYLSNFRKRSAMQDSNSLRSLKQSPMSSLASTIPLRKKHRSSPNSLKTTRAIRSSKARIIHSSSQKSHSATFPIRSRSPIRIAEHSRTY